MTTSASRSRDLSIRGRAVRAGLLLALLPALVLILILVLACSDGDSEATALDGGRLHLSADGGSLGPFGVGTPFDAGALQELLPNVAVTEAVGASEGEPYPILRLSRGEAPLFDVHSADGRTLHAIEILDGAADLVEGLGVRHGAALSSLYPPQTDLPCNAGMEEESGHAICRSPQTEHVQLLFSGEWNGPDGYLPPREILETWTVQRIFWRPSPP